MGWIASIGQYVMAGIICSDILPHRATHSDVACLPCRRFWRSRGLHYHRNVHLRTRDACRGKCCRHGHRGCRRSLPSSCPPKPAGVRRGAFSRHCHYRRRIIHHCIFGHPRHMRRTLRRSARWRIVCLCRKAHTSIQGATTHTACCAQRPTTYITGPNARRVGPNTHQGRT